MQTFIERYIEQGEQRGKRRGSAAILLRQIDRRFGPPDEPLRARIATADADTLRSGPSASWTPRRSTTCCIEPGA